MQKILNILRKLLIKLLMRIF